MPIVAVFLIIITKSYWSVSALKYQGPLQHIIEGMSLFVLCSITQMINNVFISSHIPMSKLKRYFYKHLFVGLHLNLNNENFSEKKENVLEVFTI